MAWWSWTRSFSARPRKAGAAAAARPRRRVLVGLSLTAEGRPRQLRFAVLERSDRAHLEQAIEAMVAPGARVRTNGLRGYLSLGDKGFAHERVMAKDTSFSRGTGLASGGGLQRQGDDRRHLSWSRAIGRQASPGLSGRIRLSLQPAAPAGSDLRRLCRGGGRLSRSGPIGILSAGLPSARKPSWSGMRIPD